MSDIVIQPAIVVTDAMRTECKDIISEVLPLARTIEQIAEKVGRYYLPMLWGLMDLNTSDETMTDFQTLVGMDRLWETCARASETLGKAINLESNGFRDPKWLTNLYHEHGKTGRD